MTLDELKALLESQEKEALVDILIEIVKEDWYLANRLLVLFTDDWLDEAGGEAMRQGLRSALECIDVDWDGDYVLCESAQKALALFYLRIDKAIASGRYKEAIAMLIIVEEEIIALDRYGIGVDALLDDVTTRFDAMASISFDEAARSDLFWHLVDTYPDESRCRHLALALARTKEEQAALWAVVEEDSFDQDIAFELLLRTASRAEQEAFLSTRKANYHVYKRAIEDAIESGEWERVVSYCLKAQERLSFFDEWKSILLGAYLELGMVEEARSLSFWMVINRNLDYTKLKALTPSEQ